MDAGVTRRSCWAPSPGRCATPGSRPAMQTGIGCAAGRRTSGAGGRGVRAQRYDRGLAARRGRSDDANVDSECGFVGGTRVQAAVHLRRSSWSTGRTRQRGTASRGGGHRPQAQLPPSFSCYRHRRHRAAGRPAPFRRHRPSPGGACPPPHPPGPKRDGRRRSTRSAPTTLQSTWVAGPGPRARGAVAHVEMPLGPVIVACTDSVAVTPDGINSVPSALRDS